MSVFDVQEEFLLDGKPFKILSGAIHYFRVHPCDWYHSLFNLKALGFNTVETYIPWNLHEPKKGKFYFEGQLDVQKFLDMAQDLGLYAIVRPSPYICAEWEFGGLPAWLLSEKDMRPRSSDELFLKAVERYYDVLLPKLVPHQLHHGGNILMFQVENEYGSYGQDKVYVRAIKKFMQDRGLEMPLFTSDGPWRATLRAGSLIEDDVLVTGNFGSKATQNFADMQVFFDEHHKKWPLMCMEFWDGWFNRWGETVIRREPEELAQAVKETMDLGSINLYMFHGGTNFGFMNGCSARKQKDLPQVTSYDYDALLDEQGNPTKKYFAVYDMLQTYYPHLKQDKPLYKECLEEKEIPLSNKVSLFSVIEDIAQVKESVYPQTMEDLSQEYGYILYRTNTLVDADVERYRVIDASDRVQFFVNEKHVTTQYRDEIGDDILVESIRKTNHQLDVLVENMGRVNYGHKYLAHTQHKGIRTGVSADLHFLLNWKQYLLPFENSQNIDFSKEWHEGVPSFYRYEFNIEEVKDTFIDMSGFGKGFVWVNGFNVGRYWEKGPFMTLYVPSGLLKQGENTVIVFETEGKYKENITLKKEHIILEYANEEEK
ncbi:MULTISPECIES: beta-galactosidase [unclassified Granulicatella]|uniref:glycoside hydrolase family 35 protein n=1 Tax=unclassified Granulicatella TaxID=2630493 RepID=UPI001073D89C|nr:MULTISPECIES: beta-galactosidase [unclassified Granulicatella]MBF0779957.1 beta-galactosidase [Granulicatella sp. 19428wC4_WM01]TFU95973.1 beta-galactosidase [Granulicatella sp. WM01]